jgi:hypothetical protein
MNNRSPGPCSLICAVVLVAAACGPSAKDVRTAKDARYSCAEGQLVDAVNAQMRETFGGIASTNPDERVIVSQLRWHSANGVPKQKGPAPVGPGDLGFAVVLQLVEVHQGYAIKAAPMVLSHVVGSPRGEELRPGHADWPSWAQEKTDVFQVKLHQRLNSCVKPE